ncbi:Nitroreductase-like protein [Xylariaceae sp. FL1272]|nr:Nitroreductase-like protein [Xylariaceae sp. FL1272]
MQESQTPPENSSTTPSPEQDKMSAVSMLLDEAILSRHSSRLYTSKPVPREILETALELATHSPSNSNTQAWRLFIVTGAALKRLTSALGEGWQIPREDAEARKAAVLRNFEFSRAAVGVVVCMSDSLPGRAAFSVRMYVQTFLLGLTERGVGSCVEVSISGYTDVVKREVGIPEHMPVLCGISIGYEDKSVGVNHVRSGREFVEKIAAWVDE